MDALAGPDTGAVAAGVPDWKRFALAPAWKARQMAQGWTRLRSEYAGAAPWVWLMTVGMGFNPLAALISIGRFMFDYLRSAGFSPLHGGVLQQLLFAAVHLPLMALSGLIPLLAIGYGSLMIFFPSVRRRRLEQQYALSEWQPTGPVQIAIFAFARRLMPEVTITANLRHSHLLAFVYPGGATEARLAVFGGLLLLWQRDREAAQAVVAHELAHVRRGEALHLGAGSGLETSLRVGLISMLIAPLLWLVLGLLNWQLLGILLSSALGAFGIYAVLLAAFWCSEFQADRLAAEELGSSAGLLRALEHQQERSGRISRLLARLTHPPMAWRRAMLKRSAPQALLASNLLFMAGVTLRGLLQAGSIIAGYLILGSEVTRQIGAAMSYESAMSEITMSGSGFMVAGLGFVLWPLLHYRWASTWSRQPVMTLRAPAWPWLVSLLVCFVLSFGNLLLTIFCYFDLLGAPEVSAQEAQRQQQQREELLKGIMEQQQQIMNNWQTIPDPGSLNLELLTPDQQYAPEGGAESRSSTDSSSDGSTVWDSFDGYGEGSEGSSNSSDSGDAGP